jgi:DNA modification methylase
VLRDDGVLWLNLGDSYNSPGPNNHDKSHTIGTTKLKGQPGTRGWSELKPKDLIGIPWRVAFALQADGWWLRMDNIWEKPNPMPESVTDRPTKAHEYVFLMSKSERYFYDHEAIKETAAHPTRIRADRFGGNKHTKATTKHSDGSIYAGSATRNKRSVWTVSTKPFPGAHFATFPPDLIEPMILAGTSEKGCCPECGAPYAREVVRTGHVNRRKPAHVPGHCSTKTDSTGWAPVSVATDNWSPTCTCNAGPPIPCTVLDPFGGSGTVSMVAKRFGRHSIYIDLNREYVDMAVRRTLGE